MACPGVCQRKLHSPQYIAKPQYIEGAFFGANCALAGSTDLPTTVMPFVLRAVSLRAVDSIMCPIHRRKTACSRLMRNLPRLALDMITPNVITLDDLPARSADLLAGRIRGRHIVNVKA